MIFRIEKDSTIKQLNPLRNLKELEIEKYIMSSAESDEQIFHPDVFGEELFPISNEVMTPDKKRADILAIDKLGNGVIIELKRDEAKLGVESQALQYLAAFSNYKGTDFISYISSKYPKYRNSLEERIQGFLGPDIGIDEINKNSRIILMARSFDPSLYSMGMWLASCGVPFRCITYIMVEIKGERYIGFSISFDQSTSSIYPLSFQKREPQYFWHNIGRKDQWWWDYLLERKQISASFSNQLGDLGEQTLKKYIKGDKIIAYSREFGAVGWGIIENPQSYELIQLNDKDDKLHGEHRHRISITWKVVAPKLSGGLPPAIIRKNFDIYHPISTSVKIDPVKAKRLIEELNHNRTFNRI